VVGLLALAWLVIDLGIAIKTVGAGMIATTQVAMFLPSITASSLAAGAGLGVIAVGRLDPKTRNRRLLHGLAAGAVVGLISAGGMLLAYHHGSSVAAVAITVGVSALIGGAGAAARPIAAVAAGIAGTLAYALVSFVEAYFRNDLLNLFGAGDTVGTYATADHRLSIVVSIVTGVAGGVGAFIYLRRTGLALPWPAYLVAGATTGLVLLLSELTAWAGGAPLMRAVGKLSAFDKLALTTLQPGRINHDLYVFFAGALTAMILVGRTLKRPTASGPAPKGRTTPARGPRPRRR